MKIDVVKSRECCTWEDLKPIEGTPKRELRIPEWMFCVHCGRHHCYDSFMDEAGSRDWRYVKAAAPWDREKILNSVPQDQ